MYLTLYPRLSTRSRRAIRKKYGSHGRLYGYRPRGTLLQRLAEETGMTTEQVYVQLQKEREYLLKLDARNLT